MAKAMVKFDIRYTEKRFLKKFGQADERLKKMVLYDSNKYVPVDSGKLRDSGRVFKTGIKWRTPYAKKQYYTIPRKISRGNGLGTWRWFEYAKDINKKKWFFELSKLGLRIKE